VHVFIFFTEARDGVNKAPGRVAFALPFVASVSSGIVHAITAPAYRGSTRPIRAWKKFFQGAGRLCPVIKLTTVPPGYSRQATIRRCLGRAAPRM